MAKKTVEVKITAKDLTASVVAGFQRRWRAMERVIRTVTRSVLALTAAGAAAVLGLTKLAERGLEGSVGGVHHRELRPVVELLCPTREREDERPRGVRQGSPGEDRVFGDHVGKPGAEVDGLGRSIVHVVALGPTARREKKSCASP